MKSVVIALGVVSVLAVSACSAQPQRADNTIQTISPLPETSASLVPGPNHSYNVGGSVGAEGK